MPHYSSTNFHPPLSSFIPPPLPFPFPHSLHLPLPPFFTPPLSYQPPLLLKGGVDPVDLCTFLNPLYRPCQVFLHYTICGEYLRSFFPLGTHLFSTIMFVFIFACSYFSSLITLITQYDIYFFLIPCDLRRGNFEKEEGKKIYFKSFYIFITYHM